MRAKIVTSREAQARSNSSDWGSITWLADEKGTGSRELSVARVVIRAGRENPLHVHDNSDEVLHLLSGRLLHRVGEETVDLDAGDTLLVPAGMAHNARCTGGEDAVMVVAYSKGTRAYRELGKIGGERPCGGEGQEK